VDLKLNDYDLDLTDGELSFVTGIDAVRQDLEVKLRTFLNETPYDRGAGVPWLQIIFVRGVTISAVRFILEQRILAVDGITEVLQLDTVIDRATRELTVTGRVVGLDQEFPFETQVQP
jgi:hypothetical protein